MFGVTKVNSGSYLAPENIDNERFEGDLNPEPKSINPEEDSVPAPIQLGSPTTYAGGSRPYGLMPVRGYGESKYDKTITDPEDLFDLNDYRASQQSWGRKLVHGVGVRLPLTTLTKLGEGIGYTLGAAQWAMTGDINDMQENPIAKFFSEAEEGIKSLAPIYQSTAIKESESIWDHIGSMSFWMDEGIDAAAFFAGFAALGYGVPAAIGKAGKALQLGSKLTGQLSLGAATTVQTVSEAGTEASHWLKEWKQKIPEIIQPELEKWYAENNPKMEAELAALPLISGTVSRQGDSEVFTSDSDKLREQIINKYKADFEKFKELKTQEALTKGAESAAAIFRTNVSILLGPNLLMNKMLFGKFNSAAKVIDRTVDTKTAAVLKVPRTLTSKEAALRFGKTVGTSMISESFWEEGLQGATTEYFEKLASGETDKSFLPGMIESYGEMIGTVDGQKAVFLSGVLSLLGGVGGAIRQNKQLNTQVKQLHEVLARNPYTVLDRLFLRDLAESGKSIEEIINTTKAYSGVMGMFGDNMSFNKFVEEMEKLREVGKLNTKSMFADAAALKGDKFLAGLIENDAFLSKFYPYFTTEGGLEVAKKQLESISEQEYKEYFEKEGFEPSKSLSEFVVESNKRLDIMQKIVNQVNDYYGAFNINLSNRLNLDSKQYDAEVNSFLQSIVFAQISSLNQAEYTKDFRNKLESDLSTLFSKEGVQSIEELKKKSGVNKATITEAENKTKQIKEANNLIEDFNSNFELLTDNKVLQDYFDELVKTKQKVVNELKDAEKDPKNTSDKAVLDSEELRKIHSDLVHNETLFSDEEGNIIPHTKNQAGEIISPSENAIEQIGKFEGTAEVTLTKTDKDGNVTEETVPLKFKEVREGGLVFSVVKDKSNTLIGLQSGNQLSITKNTEGYSNPKNFKITETALQTRDKAIKESYRKVFQSHINGLNQTIKNVSERIQSVINVKNSLLKSIAKIKELNKKERISVADIKAIFPSDERMVEVFTDILNNNPNKAKKIINQATISLSLFQMEQLLEEVEKLETELNTSLESSRDKLQKIEITTERAYLEIFADNIRDLREGVKNLEQSSSKMEGLKQSIRNSIKKLESYLKGLGTQIGNVRKKYMELSPYITDPDLEQYTDQYYDQIRELVEKIEALERNKQSVEAKIELKKSEIEDLDKSIFEISKQIDAIQANIDNNIKWQQKFHKKFLEHFNKAEVNVVGGKDITIKYAPDKEVDPDDIDPKQPNTGNVSDFHRTTANEAIYHGSQMEAKEGQLLFQAFIDELNKDNHLLEVHTREKLLENFEQYLSEAQINWLKSDESKGALLAVIINKETGTPTIVNSAITGNPRDTIMFAFLRNVMVNAPNGIPTLMGEGGNRFITTTVKDAVLRNKVINELKKENPDKKEFTEKEIEDKANDIAVANAMTYHATDYSSWEQASNENKPIRLQITEKTSGKVAQNEGLDGAETVPSKAKGTIIAEDATNSELNKVQLEVPAIDTVFDGDKSVGVNAGHVYVIHKGAIVKAHRQKLTAEDQQRALRFIKYIINESISNKRLTGEAKAAIANLGQLIHLYRYEGDGKKHSGEFNTYFTQSGAGATTIRGLMLGERHFNASAILNGEYDSEILEFLSNKFYQVESNPDKLKNLKYDEFDIVDGKRKIVRSWNGEGGYKGYLMADSHKDGKPTTPKLLFKLNKLVSFEDRISSPTGIKQAQFLNRSLKYKLPQKETKPNKDSAVAETTEDSYIPTAEELKEITSGQPAFIIGEKTPKESDSFEEDDFENDDMAAILAEAAEFNREKEGITKTTESPTEKSDEKTVVNPLSNRKSFKKASDTADETFMSETQIGAIDTVLTETERREFVKKFGDIVFSGRLPKGKVAQLQGVQGALRVIVSPDAVAGSLFHEGWHIVRKFFTSEAEQKELFDEVKRRLAGTKYTISGQTYEINEATPEGVLDEILAEEFRHYYLLGPSNYTFGKNTVVQQNIFKRIWNAIVNFFMGANAHKQNNIEAKFAEIMEKDYSSMKIEEMGTFAADMKRIGEFSVEESIAYTKWMNEKFMQELFDTSKNYLDRLDSDFDGVLREVHREVKKNLEDRAEFIDNNADNIETLITDYLGINSKEFSKLSSKEINNLLNVINREYKSLINIYENFGEVSKAYKKFLNAHSIKVDEITDVFADNEEAANNHKQMVESNLFDVRNDVPTKLKLLLIGLTSYEGTGAKINKFGLKETVRPALVIGYLHNKLANVPQDRMLSVLKNVSERYPHYQKLYDIINSDTKVGFELKAQFLHQFSKVQRNYWTNLISFGGDSYFVNSVSATAQSRVLDKWKNNLKLRIQDKNIKAGPFSIDKKNGRVLISKGDINIDNKIVTIGETISLAQFTIPQLIKLFNAFGIEISSEVINERDSQNLLLESATWLLKSIKRELTPKEPLYIDDIFSYSRIEQMGRLSRLAELESRREEYFISNQYRNANGQSEYSLGLKHYLDQIIDTLNNTPEAFNVFDGKQGTPEFANSLWIEHAKAGNQIGYAVLRSLGGEIAEKQDFADLKPGDLVLMEFNAVLTGKFPSLRAASRGMEYTYDFGKSYIQDRFKDKLSLDYAYENTFIGYLKAEIYQALYENLKSNKEINGRFVKTGKQGGLKYFKQLMNDKSLSLNLDKDIEIESAAVNNLEDIINATNRIIEANDKNIKKVYSIDYKNIGKATNFRAVEVRITRDMLIKAKILKPHIENGEVVSYEVNGIGEDILQKFKINSKKEGKVKVYPAEDIIKLVDIFTYYYNSSSIEQSKIVTGSFTIFKDKDGEFSLHKRTNSFTSTRSESINTEDFIQKMDEYYPRLDGKKRTKFFRDVVYADVVVSSVKQLADIYHKALNDDTTPYSNHTENDAYGIATFDGYRDLTLRAEGEWTESQEKSLQHQMQLFMQAQLINREGRVARLTQDEYKEMFNQHLPEDAILDRTYFKGKEITVEEQAYLEPLAIKKPVSVGKISKVITKDGESNVIDFNKSEITKTAISLPLASDILNTNLEDLMWDSIQNGVDFIFPKSAKKAEMLGNEKGKLSPFYNKETGTITLPSQLLEQGYSFEEISWSNIGNQLDIDPFGHDKVTLSTQKDNLTFIDVFDGGKIRPEFSDVEKEFQEFNNIKAELSIRGLDRAIDKLGLSKSDANEFSLVNNQAFMDFVKEQFENRTLPESVIDAVESIIMSAKEYKFIDAAPTKRQITNMLYALVRNNAISIKVSGDMLIQRASTGMETNRPNTTESNFLKFYRPVDKDGNIVEWNSPEMVRIAPMEVMISLPNQWKRFVLTLEGRNFDEKLAKFNELWKSPEYDKIRVYLANRIPGQHLNSLEAAEVVKFLNPQNGPTIILPTEVVTKSGSDFDVDKLTTYFNNVRFDKEGKPVYVEYLTDENSTKEERYNKYLRYSVKDYDSIYKESKDSSVEGIQLKQELNENFVKYQNSLKELRGELLQPFYDKLNSIRQSIEQGKDASQDIYDIGYDIFQILPPSIKKNFFDLNSILNRKIAAEEIQSFDKTIHFKQKALELLKIFKGNKISQIEYVDKKGNTVIDNVNHKETTLILNNLVANYDLYLNSIGWTSETIKEFQSTLESLKEGKEEYKEAKQDNKESYLKDMLNKDTFESFNKLFNETLADVFKLKSLEEFSKLPIHKQNSLKAIQNRFNEIGKQLVLHNNNFPTLIKPNNSNFFQSMANEIMPKKSVEIHKLGTFGFNIEVGLKLLNALSQVGQAAVATTFHAKTLANPIELSTQLGSNVKTTMFRLFFKEFQGNNAIPYLGHTQSRDNNNISDYNQGFVTAAVDAEKEGVNTALHRLNLTPATSNVFFMLNRIGTQSTEAVDGRPMGAKQILYFLNQPIIKRFEELSRIHESEFSEVIFGEKPLSKDQIIKQVLKEYGIDVKTVRLLHPHLNAVLREDNPNERIKKLSTLHLELSKVNNYLELTPKIADVATVLNYYLYYKELAKVYNQLQQGSRQDAQMTKEGTSALVRERRLRRLMGFNLINKESIEKLFSNSFLGAFKDAHDTAPKMFKQFFAAQQLKSLYNFLYGDKGLINIYDNLFVNKPEKEVVAIMQKLENATISYILHTTKLKDKLSSRYQELLLGPNSVAKRLAKLKDANPDNYALQELTPILDEFIRHRNKPAGIDYIKLLNRKLTSEEHDNFTDSIRELYDIDDKFVLDLVDLSIIQSGVQISPVAFYEILPVEYYTPRIAQLLKTYAGKQDIDVNKATRDIFSNLAEYARDVVPKVYVSERTGKVKLSDNGETLIVSDETQVSNYPYLVREEIAVDAVEKNKLEQAGKSIPKHIILYERRGKTPDNSAFIYKHIPIQGVGYRFFEVVPEGSKSVVGSKTTNVPVPSQTQPQTERKLFNPQDTTLKKGSVVEYNGKKYLFWNQNASGKAQLINTDGSKFSGTPNIDKLKVIGSYKTVIYNNTEYIVTDNDNIYSGATGNLVYTESDNSSKVQKQRIINTAKGIVEGSEMTQKESTETRLPDAELDSVLKQFFDTFGFTIKPGDKIFFKGEEVDAAGKLNLLKKTVDIVTGKAKIDTLPEEAAHLYVRLLGRDNPLYKTMYRNIVNYEVYNEVTKEYYNDYNGNEELLREEAIGKLIAQEIVKQHTEKLSPEQKDQVKNWWKRLLAWINSKFSTENDGYKRAAYNILNNKYKKLKGIKEDRLQQNELLSKFENKNAIKYTFKGFKHIIDNLPKVKSWYKNITNKETFWNKVQKDLQISKEQVDLLKQTKGETIEEILSNFLANYSFTVEINTSLTKPTSSNAPIGGYFEFNNNYYGKFEDAIEEGKWHYRKNHGEKITEKEYLDALKSLKVEYKQSPTQHHDELIVPGGVNYVENAIRIPGVVNVVSQEGGYHDNEFNQSRGDMAGWFRSDDKIYDKSRTKDSEYLIMNDKWRRMEISTDEMNNWINNNFTDGTKIRRILELQSFFQKVRDKEQIASVVDDFGKPLSEQEADAIRSEFGDVTLKENQFLQLLNKDNNWVTFFIKSIIQDSAKKGYKKVLFPKGETAAKIEGHQTLSDEIKTINSKLEELKTIDELYALDVGYIKRGEKGFDKLVEFNRNELEQRKQDLKSQGIEKLKPIEAFYEIRIGKILETQFGKENVKTITDEYGNQWREITIEQSRDLGTIMLQKTPKRLEMLDDVAEARKREDARVAEKLKLENEAVIKKNKAEIDKVRPVESKTKVKEGVDFVFEQNKELSEIGTQEQYSQYLDTIFPDYIDNFAYEAVEEFLVVNKIIDRKC